LDINRRIKEISEERKTLTEALDFTSIDDEKNLTLNRDMSVARPMSKKKLTMTSSHVVKKKNIFRVSKTKDTIQKLQDEHRYVDLLQMQLKIDYPKRKRRPWFRRN